MTSTSAQDMGASTPLSVSLPRRTGSSGPSLTSPTYGNPGLTSEGRGYTTPGSQDPGYTADSGVHSGFQTQRPCFRPCPGSTPLFPPLPGLHVPVSAPVRWGRQAPHPPVCSQGPSRSVLHPGRPDPLLPGHGGASDVPYTLPLTSESVWVWAHMSWVRAGGTTGRARAECVEEGNKSATARDVLSLAGTR